MSLLLMVRKVDAERVEFNFSEMVWGQLWSGLESEIEMFGIVDGNLMMWLMGGAGKNFSESLMTIESRMEGFGTIGDLVKTEIL